MSPHYPSLYQINTRGWLTEFSQKLRRKRLSNGNPRRRQMANTETFGVIGVGGIRATDTWGPVREDDSEGGDAWNLLRRGAPDVPPQEGTR
jgi:hypothetical protein